MTVKELKELLENYDDDHNVVMFTVEGAYEFTGEHCKGVYADDDEFEIILDIERVG